MNNDLISRAALLERFELAKSNVSSLVEAIFFDGVMAMVDNAPAVDAEPVRHAAWERYPGPGYIRCTGCKMEFDENKMPFARNFCPFCGAKMDMEESK